jgi:hypothetical protein
MYCSACGHALVPNQPVCPQCGRPVAAVPPVPGLGFELSSYVSRLRALAVVWYIYGGLSLAFGLIGMAFLDSWLHGRFNYWTHGPIPPMWLGPAIHFAWVFTITRAGLALAAGYGLMHREPWGRIVAIVSAFVNIIKFPFGTALAIWTLITLMGYRNTTLYDSVAEV